MKTPNISVKEALSLIKTGSFDKNSAIDFNDEKIDALGQRHLSPIWPSNRKSQLKS